MTTPLKQNGGWVLAATILGSSLSFIDGTFVNIALPILQEKLGATVIQVYWISLSYSLLLSAFILVGGALGDKYGRRRIFMLGTAIFAIASLACGLSPDANVLIAARALQGFGGALLVPGSLAIISASFDKASRGKAIGTWSGFSAITAGFGPVLGGWLIQHLSWHWIFFINLPIAAVVLLICWLYVPESRDEDSPHGLDLPGVVLITLSLGGIIYGLTGSSDRGFTDPLVAASLTLGVVFLAAFIFLEWRSTKPMVPLELFRSPTFTGTNLLTLFLYAALSAVMFFLPFNLIRLQGYTPTEAGSAMLPFVVTMFVLSRWAGGLIDKFGAKLPLIIGPIITGVGFLLFALPGKEASNYWTNFFPAIVVMSLGMSLVVAPLTTAVMGSVEEHRAGVASGINNAISRTAGLLAIAVFGVVMLAGFNHTFDRELASLNAPEEVKVSLAEQKQNFTNISESNTGSDQTAAEAEHLVETSFLTGFRLVAYLAAALAFLSAICSWILVEGKPGKRK